MDDIDVSQLIEGAETLSTSVQIFERTDSVIKTDGVVIKETTTIMESISFGHRSLRAEDVIEDFVDDLLWLL